MERTGFLGSHGKFRIYLATFIVIAMVDAGSARVARVQATTTSVSNVLGKNTNGKANTALGWDALPNRRWPGENTAIGAFALFNESTGIFNTAVGADALYANATGVNNTASGNQALLSNTTGFRNTAFGAGALLNNIVGKNNIAIGVDAGSNLSTGSENIDVGNDGVAAESSTIRIGTSGRETRAFIAGISGAALGSSTDAVFVSNTGQLGIMPSAARYKRDIRDMGDASDQLMRLRPVAFRYKADPAGSQQYGLIAEEVAKVYPELVVRDAGGKPETVAYHVLPAMLLNELQKQGRMLARKADQITALQREVAALRHKVRRIEALTERLDALDTAHASKPGRLAAAMQ